MSKFIQITIILLAVTSVAIGDVFIKKATENSTFAEAITSGWMLIAILLYIVQIVLFCWMFIQGWELSIVGAMQTVLYASVIMGSSYFIFKEAIHPMQYVGISLAFIGILLANTFSS